MKKIFLILLVPSVAYSSCRVVDALKTLQPTKQFDMSYNNLNTSIWDTDKTLPTKAQIIQAVSDCQAQETARNSLKQQARLDVKNAGLTQAQRLQALLILLDFDQ